VSSFLTAHQHIIGHSVSTSWATWLAVLLQPALTGLSILPSESSGVVCLLTVTKRKLSESWKTKRSKTYN